MVVDRIQFKAQNLVSSNECIVSGENYQIHPVANKETIKNYDLRHGA